MKTQADLTPQKTCNYFPLTNSFGFEFEPLGGAAILFRSLQIKSRKATASYFCHAFRLLFTMPLIRQIAGNKMKAIAVFHYFLTSVFSNQQKQSSEQLLCVVNSLPIGRVDGASFASAPL